MVELTVIFESVETNVVGGVSEVDVTAVVRPALDDDAALLPVEREESAVDVASRLHCSVHPPVHPSRVLHPRVEQVEVLREEGFDTRVQKHDEATKIHSFIHSFIRQMQ